jgi:glycine/D-amino acid oxidase-like deaminating enzyme
MKDMSFHLSTFVGGEMYLANDIVPTLGELPDQPVDLKAQPHSIDAMKDEALKHLVLEKGESLELVSTGRAYLPQLDSKLPIITKLLWEDLYPSNSAAQPEDPGLGQTQQVVEDLSDSDSKTIGGVFLNVGHYLDGLAVGLGSGKVMAELILGKEPSVDTSHFDLASAARKVMH